MDYKLLKFKPDYSAAKSYLSFEKVYSSQISINKNSDDYDYQGFEYGNHSLEIVCSHASAMVARIERDNNDENARKELCRDYENALKCLKTGKRGRRQIIDFFTKYMLDKEWEGVVNCISEFYKDNNSKEQDELLPYYYLPDYSQLFVRRGDQALFIENDYDKAIAEYTVATFEWRCKSGVGDKGDYIQVSAKHKIKAYIDLFESIKDGSYRKCDYSFLSKDEKQIVLCYNQIINDYNSHEKIIENVDDLIGNIENIIRKIPCAQPYASSHPMFSDDGINTLRLICVIVPKLFQLALFDEIKCLSEEKKNVQDSLKQTTINNLIYFSGSEFDWITQEINASDEKIRWKLLISIAKIEDDIKEIKKRLILKGNVPDLAYYTTWTTFSYMLPAVEKSSNNDNVGKLSVMHLSYMNDPMEGKVIKERHYLTHYTFLLSNRSHYLYAF